MSYEEQIMSKDKYPSIFSPQMATLVFIILQIFFATRAVLKLKLGNIYTIVAIWHENMLGYLSADIICSEKRTVFRERSSRKTVSYEEQIMSKDKCPSIFSPQMGAIVFYYPSSLFRNARSFENWGIFNN